MTADQYVSSTLAKYTVSRGPQSVTETIANSLAPSLIQWSNGFLSGPILFSGSYAKGTGIKGATDVDLFLSLKSDAPFTLDEIFESLHGWAQKQGWNPKRQDVSIGITYFGINVDLVPGRQQDKSSDYHSLRRRSGSWTQTNIAKHIQTVTSSGRIDEIRVLKLWRKLNNLDISSFYLELATIDALSGRPIGQVAANAFHALQYLGTYLPAMRIVDPANTNNILSDDYTSQEKRAIAAAAATAAQKPYWKQIIW
jgi:hypothetical protein